MKTPNADAIVRELEVLMTRQSENYRHYLGVLEQEQKAINHDDSDRMLACQRLEGSLVEKIVSVEKSFQEIHKLLPPGLSQAGIVEHKHSQCESLRTRAVEMNQSTQNLLKNRLQTIKKEMNALATTLCVIRGNGLAHDHEPRYIDLET